MGEDDASGMKWVRAQGAGPGGIEVARVGNEVWVRNPSARSGHISKFTVAEWLRFREGIHLDTVAPELPGGKSRRWARA